jgi:hypothetical protein
MKRIAFTLLVLAGALNLKAQQLPALPKSFPYKLFKQDTTKWPKFSEKPKYFVPKSLPYKNLLAAVDVKSVDYMPIVKTQGRSNMPIVQTDITGYTMPVVGKRSTTISGVYYMKRLAVDSTVVVTPAN